ncbi:MAG: sigma-70 family RNA polymerase sigma factor [Tepidisphaeraceae bacterium]|jgi:RNA polymerase sigma factor (sigma-70 family)
MTDVELLEQHRGGSDSAFADLVRRHLGWVYGVARRRLHDAHLAEDVAQAVFVLLDRKAPQFPADAAMICWLHKTAWYATESAARNERRRQRRETQAAELQLKARESADSDEPDWEHLAPLLDELIGQLGKMDREAVLLRYYRDLSFAEVGEQTGTTAEGARKRVDRAVEKLRKLAAGRGMTMSSVSLMGALATHVRIPPPPGLVATSAVTATAGAGSSLGTSSAAIVKGSLWSMAASKLAVAGIVAAALALMATGGAIAWHFAPPTNTPVVPENVPVGTAIVAPNPVPTPAPAKPPAVANEQLEARSPFSDIRWRGQTAQVQVGDSWYEWVSINDIPAASIVAFARQNVGDTWQQRLTTELPLLLSGMGHPAGATVKLGLRRLDTGEPLTLADVPMTAENARLISPQSGGVAAFSAMRWSVEMPQVEVKSQWYELAAIDGVAASDIVAFAKTKYGLGANGAGEVWWRKRIVEDLPTVLTAMGREPGHTVNLQLVNLDDGKTVTMNNVPMTEGNRESILNYEGKTNLP